ncbi:NADH:flavin oxidoreductase/NADH oxidase [Streptacidiphilus sp. MAP5-3]|uniref:NADH:flavin oxidoreductase/NADH oxidase n=1 Tax=unclassified Streptacidiphilus TaxID=2643834 RepID=UPI003516C5D7
MTQLFEPLELRDVTVPNRVWMAPMCQYSAPAEGPTANNEDVGVPGEWHFQHLASRAAGGAGLILTEATSVVPEGRISPWDLGIWNDRQAEAFRRITSFLRELGTVPGIQLAHAGRKASTHRPWEGGSGSLAADHPLAWRSVAPSAVPFGSLTAPDELTVDQIGVVVRRFAEAAERALAAGFQVVEVHGAHGYLVHEFLSPFSNKRTDAYGGPVENRMRFALEVAEAVRAVWPEHLPVFFRVSATDWLDEGGWAGDDTVLLAKELQSRGIDLLDVSTGGNVPDGSRIPVEPGYQVPFAARVRNETGLATAAVGLITDPHQAEQIVASGQADAVLLGRELLRDPYWARHAASALGHELPKLNQYARS